MILVKLIGIGNDESKRINNKDNDDDDSDNDDDDSKSDSIENSVYWCLDEASEYKGWVIKLDLTTPVKF